MWPARLRPTEPQIIVREATYTFLELKAWRDQLSPDILSIPGVVWLDLDEAQNRVVIGVAANADLESIRRVARELAVPAAAVEFEVTGTYVSEKTLRDEFRPIEGGILIQRLQETDDPISSTLCTVTSIACEAVRECTLGFTALWNNEPVFLTASHCSRITMETDSVEQFQPAVPGSASDSATITPIGREIFDYSEPCGTSSRCSWSDAAIYDTITDTTPPIPSQQWVLGRIAKPETGCFPGCDNATLEIDATMPYWTVVATKQSFVLNDLVSKIGIATGWSQHLVQKTCTDVSPQEGLIFYCQVFAGYLSRAGDSGAPVLLDIHTGDRNVVLGGIHHGRTSNDQYAVFSPWSGIVQNYGSLTVF